MGAFELDGVEAVVALELYRAVDEGVAVAEFFVDVEDGGGEVGSAALLVEDAAAGELGDGTEGFLAGVDAGFVVGDEGVDGCLVLLALVDDVLGEGAAAVIDAVGEEKDGVGGGCIGGRLRGHVVAAGAIERVPYGGAAEARAVEVGDVGCGLDEKVGVAGPILLNLGFEVEAKDHGLIAGIVESGLGDELGGPAGSDGSFHRGAFVEENGKAQGKVVVVLEEGDAAGWVAVIEQAQVGLSDVGDGSALFVDCMEVNGDFVGIDGELEWLLRREDLRDGDRDKRGSAERANEGRHVQLTNMVR